MRDRNIPMDFRTAAEMHAEMNAEFGPPRMRYWRTASLVLAAALVIGGIAVGLGAEGCLVGRC